jgi:hypothetical protein
MARDRGLQIYAGTGPIKVIADTSHTLRRDDEGLWLRFTSGSSVTLTVPDESVHGFLVGTVITINQAGAGLVTVAGNGVGSIVVETTNTYVSAGQYAVMMLAYVASNTWVFTGDRALS